MTGGGTMIHHDAGIDQGGLGAADGASQQLTYCAKQQVLACGIYWTQVETKVDGAEPMAPGISWQYCRESFDMRIFFF